MRLGRVLLTCAVVAVAGCGSSPGSGGSGSSSIPAFALPSAAASPASSVSAAASPHTSAAAAAGVNAAICRQVESYRPPNTLAGLQKYADFVLTKSKTPGLARDLSERLQAFAFKVDSYLGGLGGSASQMQADSNQIVSTCAQYGVIRTG